MSTFSVFVNFLEVGSIYEVVIHIYWTFNDLSSGVSYIVVA